MDLGEGRPGAAEIISALDAPRPSLTTASSLLASAEPEVVVAALQHWVRHSDGPEQLLRRGWADGWLWPAIEAVWRADDDDPLAARREESMLWVAISSLSGRYSGLTFKQAEHIKALAADQRMHRGQARAHHRRVIEFAVEALRTPYVQKRTVSFGGWLYIVSAAAELRVRSGDYPGALILAQEAWGFRHGLPSTLQSAKAIVHVASQVATVSAHLRDDEAATRLEAALDGLAEAELTLDAVLADSRPGASAAVEYLNLAISRESAYRRMSLWSLIPFLDSVEKGTSALATGFEKFRKLIGLPALAELAAGEPISQSGPAVTHPAVVRALLRLSHCANRSGDRVLSAQATSASERFLRGVAQEWEWAITTAFDTGDRSQRLDRMERVLRFADNSGGISPGLRSLLVARSADVARDASRAFYREKLFTSGWFWQRVAVEWESGNGTGAGGDVLDVEDPGLETRAISPVAPIRSDSPELDSVESGLVRSAPGTAVGDLRMAKLLDRVNYGLPLPLILELFHLGKQLNSPGQTVDLSRFSEAVAAVDGWHRARRHPGEKPTPVDPADIDTLQRWMLLSAAELAAVYAPHLVPEIHLSLSKSPYLDISSKLAHARLCTVHARDAGRPNYVSAGLFGAVKIALATGDAAIVATQVGELVDAIASGGTWSPRGADLVETAYWSGRRTEKLIEELLSAEYPDAAARLFDVNAGRMHESFRNAPAFAAELQLMERALGSRTPKDEDELFRRIRSRILDGQVYSIDGVSPREPALPHADEVVVRLLAVKDRSWALMSLPHEGGVRFESVELEIGTRQVTELSDLIWYQLRPTRAGKPVTALRALHDAILAPILERVPPGATLIFSPNGAMSTLPLHAALGADGYAIERHPIAYYPTDQAAVRVSNRRSLVCGWDVSAHAEREARHVARVLRQRGHDVVLPPNARDGLEQLLSVSDPVELVHVSGHGQSMAWPRSFHSTIALSPRIQLTAGQWLTAGPRAAFVFLNVCGVGRVRPYGGDLNGFPLALRIRGAQAVIAANGFIPPEEAHRFAERFYAHAGSDDTLTAYRSAVLESIREGVPAVGWAPYAHFGRGYHLGRN
jgi:hypothetical protein